MGLWCGDELSPCFVNAAEAGRTSARCRDSHETHEEEQRLLPEHPVLRTARHRQNHVRQGTYAVSLKSVQD